MMMMMVQMMMKKKKKRRSECRWSRQWVFHESVLIDGLGPFCGSRVQDWDQQKMKRKTRQQKMEKKG